MLVVGGLRLSCEGGEAGADERMETRLNLLALRGITEDLVRHPAALFRRHKLMDDVIGIKRLNAQFVETSRKKRFPAGDSARQGNSPCPFSVM